MNLRELNHILIPSYERQVEIQEKRWAKVIQWCLTPLFALSREGRVLLLLTFVVGMAGMDVRFTPIYRVFCGLTAFFIVGLLARRLAQAEGLSLRVEHPRRITAGGELTFTLVIKNNGARPVVALRVFGPFLPWDGAWTGGRPTIPIVPPGDEIRVHLTATFTLRGRRHIGGFYVASIYPLGLFRGRMIYSDPVRFTVLPPVYPVSGLPTPPSITEPPDQRGRLYRAGESFELLGVRPYRPGDRIRDLHARSSARQGAPMVREYRRAARKRAIVMLQTCQASREQLYKGTTLAASLVQWAIQIDALVEVLISGQAPLTVGAHAAGVGVALDVLANAHAEAEPVNLTRLLSPHMNAPGAVFLIFARWGEAEAALWAQARKRAPMVYAFSLHGSPPPEVRDLSKTPIDGPLKLGGAP